jgi:hypothetical protein
MRMEKMYVTCMLEVVKLHNKFGLSMMVFKAVIGLRRRMVIYVDKFGLRMVVYVALCLVMLLYKVGLYVVLCMEKMLYYVALRLEVKELITVGPCIALRLEIYLDMIGLFMVALQNFMVFLVTNVFMVALHNFMVFLEMNDFMVVLLNYMVFFVMDVFKGMNLWVSHQCRHRGSLLVEVAVERWNCHHFQMGPHHWNLEIGFVFAALS